MDLSALNFAAVPAITAICYLAAECVKASKTLNNELLPVICMALGGILGVVAMYVMPDFVASDVLTAIAIGIVSGAGATGVHQAIKAKTRGGEYSE